MMHDVMMNYVISNHRQFWVRVDFTSNPYLGLHVIAGHDVAHSTQGRHQHSSSRVPVCVRDLRACVYVCVQSSQLLNTCMMPLNDPLDWMR